MKRIETLLDPALKARSEKLLLEKLLENNVGTLCKEELDILRGMVGNAENELIVRKKPIIGDLSVQINSLARGEDISVLATYGADSRNVRIKLYEWMANFLADFLVPDKLNFPENGSITLSEGEKIILSDSLILKINEMLRGIGIYLMFHKGEKRCFSFCKLKEAMPL